MTVSKPPDPPASARDWHAFAEDLRRWLDALPQELQSLRPQPIQLPHVDVTGAGLGGLPRATEDGILAYDPEFESVMVSTNGSWRALVSAAYGGMAKDDAPAAGADLTTTWIPIDQFSALTVPNEHVIFDPVANTFSFDTTGVYQVNYILALEHNSSGATRSVDFRMYNVTDAVAGRPLREVLGSGITSTTFTGGFLADIYDTDVGDVFRLEISSQVGANVTSVMWSTQNVSAARVGAVA